MKTHQIYAILLLIGIYSVASQPQCDFSNTFCTLANPGVECPNENTNVISLDGALYSFRNFDVISFSDLRFNDGEIQGRVAVKNNFIGSGGSIGTRIDPLGGDINLPYSLVVHGDASWNDGTLYPIGTFQENIYVGGSFSSNSQNLISRNLGGNCTANPTNPDCLNNVQHFENSQKFWNDLSDNMATTPINVATNVNNGVLTLTCFLANQTLYIVSIDGNEFNQVTSYAVVNCQPVSMWIFNILGSNPEITFKGEPIATPAPNIYNIVGSNRLVNVNTRVQGSIVNSRGSFNQVKPGVVFGSVVANNIISVVQVNRPISCVNPGGEGNLPTTTSPSPSTSTSTSLSTSTSASTTGRIKVTTSPASSSSSTSSPTPTSTSSVSSGTTECVCPPTSSTSSSTFDSVTTGVLTGNNEHPQNCPFVDDDQLIDSSSSSSFNQQYQCPSKLSFSLNGKDLSFKNYHVISFNGFRALTGDIEGRVAARGNIQLGGGFSVGDKIDNSNDRYSADKFSTYSLISNELTWISGQIYPVQGGPTNTREETMFVGSGNYNVPSYLESKVTGQCDQGSDCLKSIFDEAKNCYTGVQNYLSSLEDNVQHSIKYSQLKFTCNNNKEKRYIVSFSSSILDSVTWFGMSNCNPKAQWVINVKGEGESQSEGDVSFHGDSFPISNAENVLWNIIGTGRVIHVGTAVNGGILAPNNYLNQTSGVIRGKVVVGGVVMSLQINKPICEKDSYETMLTSTSSSSSSLTSPKANENEEQNGDTQDNSPSSSSSSLSIRMIPLIYVLYLVISLFF